MSESRGDVFLFGGTRLKTITMFGGKNIEIKN